MLYQRLKGMKRRATPRDINPFGPENILIFATGPGTSVTGFPSSGRYHVMALKSPLTESIESANSGVNLT